MNVSLQMTFRCIVAFAGLCAPCVVHAQQSDDKSGTNPSVLHRTASVSNEYRALPDDYFYDVANFRYVEPMLDGRVALRLTVPLEATDLPSFDDAGIGDVASGASGLPTRARNRLWCSVQKSMRRRQTKIISAPENGSLRRA